MQQFVFQGVVSGGGSRKAQPPKTSSDARFRVVWGVVGGRERPNHQKQAFTLVFGWCGWWWWAEESPTTENKQLRSFSGGVGGGGGQRKAQRPKNERDHSFLGVVGGGGGQRKVKPTKTSSRARFRGGAGKRKTQLRKRVVVLVFERCGWWWAEKWTTPKNERDRSFSGCVGGGGCQKGWWW